MGVFRERKEERQGKGKKEERKEGGKEETQEGGENGKRREIRDRRVRGGGKRKKKG